MVREGIAARACWSRGAAGRAVAAIELPEDVATCGAALMATTAEVAAVQSGSVVAKAAATVHC